MLALSGVFTLSAAAASIPEDATSSTPTQRPPARTEVILGKNGFLFYLPEWAEFDPTPAELNIIRTARALDNAGIKLVVALAPIKARIYQDMLPGDRPLSPSLAGRYKSVVNHLRSKGVIVADTNSSLLTARRISKDPLYYPTDTHWSPDGASVAARTVAASIRQVADIGEFPLLKQTRRVGEMERVGDLPNLLPEESRFQYKSAPFRTYVYEVLSRQPEDLLDDTDQPEIVVVGTSYSNEAFKFVPALGHALQRDVLNASIPGQGPWRPMLEYLNGAAFKAAKPKVIVWEIPERTLNAVVPSGWLEEGILPALKPLQKDAPRQ